MATKQELEMRKVAEWMNQANSNSLLTFQHMAHNIALDRKIGLERAQILAYRRMCKKGMILG